MTKGGDELIVEVCDLCKKPVDELHKTEVIIKDYKRPRAISLFCDFVSKRKFRGVICDDCLRKLRGEEVEKYGRKEVRKYEEINPPLIKIANDMRGGLKNIYKTTILSTEPEDN